MKLSINATEEETVEVLTPEHGRIDICVHIPGITCSKQDPKHCFYNRVVISRTGNYISDILQTERGSFWSKGYYAHPTFHPKGITRRN